MGSKIPIVVSIVVSVFLIIPLAIMVYGSLVPSFVSRALTSDFLVQALSSNFTPGLILNTLQYGFFGGLLAVALGASYAWFMTRTDVPGKRFLNLLPILPLTLPPLVKGFAWVFLFSPQIGLVNLAIEGALHTSTPIFNIYSMGGLVFAWGIGGLPIAYLVLESAMVSTDPELEEAARACGSGILGTARRITLPLNTTALFSAFLLLSIEGIQDFNYPFILGSASHISTLATYVYDLGSAGETSLAAAYGVVYLVITLVLITVYVRTTRMAFRFTSVTGRSKIRTLEHLRGWRWPSFVLLAVMMSIAYFLPLVTIAFTSVVPYFTVCKTCNLFGNLTLENYAAAFALPSFTASVYNSFILGLGAATTATVIALFISYALIKSKTRGKKVLEYVATMPLAIPGIVYSVALLWTFLLLPVFNQFVYGTLWALLIALTMGFLPTTIRIISSEMVQISDELEEASSVAGAGWLHGFRTVLAPILRPSIYNSFVFVLMESFREVASVVLLVSGSSILLIVVILDLFQSSAGRLPVIAALSTIMTLMLWGTLVVTKLVSRLITKR